MRDNMADFLPQKLRIRAGRAGRSLQHRAFSEVSFSKQSNQICTP